MPRKKVWSSDEQQDRVGGLDGGRNYNGKIETLLVIGTAMLEDTSRENVSNATSMWKALEGAIARISLGMTASMDVL